MAVKSGKIPLGYHTSSQSHTFYKPTFIVWCSEWKRTLQNSNTEFWN